MKLRKVQLVGILLLSAASLSGCSVGSPATSAQEITACEDTSNPASWDDGWTYGISDWNDDSKIYSGFGTFKCTEDATLTVTFKSLGKNLKTGNSYLSFGDDQITMVNAPMPTTKWFSGEKINAIHDGAIEIKAGVTFQPVAEVLSAIYGSDQQEEPVKVEPVQAEITIQAPGKQPIKFVKTINFDIRQRYASAAVN